MEQLTIWGEKLSWKLNGDLTEGGDRVVRIRGTHYILPTHIHTDSGFRGAITQYDIEFINGPHKGKRLMAQLMYSEEIEQEYIDLLPDNAICHGVYVNGVMQ